MSSIGIACTLLALNDMQEDTNKIYHLLDGLDDIVIMWRDINVVNSFLQEVRQ
jgi:hypothetical protein